MLFAKRKKAQIKRRLQDIENYPTRFDQSRTPDRNRLWIYKRIWHLPEFFTDNWQNILTDKWQLRNDEKIMLNFSWQLTPKDPH
jgi:hypothetical protein